MVVTRFKHVSRDGIPMETKIERVIELWLRSLHGDHVETNRSIAKKTNLDVRTVKKILRTHLLAARPE